LRKPFATRLTVHILAAVAEHEREMISARTTAALAAARARGTRLGNPALRAGDAEAARRANAARVAQADRHAADVLPYIAAARSAGANARAEPARALTAQKDLGSGGLGGLLSSLLGGGDQSRQPGTGFDR
jgi:DNA invertase Pin-like site-specific DNA recombinase